jgi:uncharacterized protein YegP (UPF0339 family)
MAQDSPQVVRREDDYLACLEYANRTEATEFAGIVKFSHSNGKNYFSWIEDGSVIMRSEGYPSESGRDNGAASVNKNREIEERYSVEEKFGKFFAVLKAGNHQEIARSCAQDSEEAARSFFPSARAKAKADREAAALAAAAASASLAASTSASSTDPSESNREEDNYMACKEYARQDVASDHSGLYKFQHENGEYYFTWTDDAGNVLMRSEGYPTTSARDNGLESVAKNREIEARFKIEEVRGYYFVVLKAGNHQEIARSCAYKDKAALSAAFPMAASSAGWAVAAAAPVAVAAMAAAPEAEVVVEAPAAVEAVAETPAAVAAAEVHKEREDDYLACAEYKDKPVNDKPNNVALFKHENGQFYFVLYNADGSVKLRSEGFESATTRDEELSGVLRYHDNPEMYTTIERAGHVLHILKDKTGREVGRSCLEKIPVAMAAAPVVEVAAAVAAVAAIIPEVVIETPAPVVEVEAPKVEIAAPVAAIAAAVTAAAVTIDAPAVEAKMEAPTPPAPPKVIIEDDYLLCREYEGHTVVDKDNNIAFFKHDNGQLYFVVYNSDGSVRLRSEGFETADERDVELEGVVKHLNNAKMYTRIDKGEYHIMVLKDETGREVGRSCMQKEAVAAAVPVAPIAVAAVAAAVTAAANIPAPKVEVPVVPPVDIPAAPIVEAIAEEGGFKWWWLLPLLLLPLMWLMCGKCKEVPVEPKKEVKTEVTKPAPAEPVKTKLGVKQFLPVTLYFDNDQPDANTKATRTAKTYSETYNAYYPLRNDFGAKGDGKATVDFFDNTVKKGMTDLEKLAAALVEITKAGEKVNLSVRGYASPLAKNDYNQALTGRRVSSIENYLNTYSNGALAAAMKSGAIKITTIPSGEEKAKGGVSDNSKDKKSSVYSVDASQERRVEIVGIE